MDEEIRALRIACLAAVVLGTAMLGGCASNGGVITSAPAAETVRRTVTGSRSSQDERQSSQRQEPIEQTVEPKPKPVAAPTQQQPPPSVPSSTTSPRDAATERNVAGEISYFAPRRGYYAEARPESFAGAKEHERIKTTGLKLKRPVLAMTESQSIATESPELSADQQRMNRRDAYIKLLKLGAYSFNPPSPIKVEQRIVVALWVDPAQKAAQLAEEMKKAFPGSAERVESGTTPWSPRMRAHLTGVDFEITSSKGKDFDGVKDLSLTGRTAWEWNIIPNRPGEKQVLHLILEAMLPPELGNPWETVLDREIDVEVTLWWLLDHYWDKYWKAILGALGTAFLGAIGWWLKNRFFGKAPKGATEGT